MFNDVAGQSNLAKCYYSDSQWYSVVWMTPTCLYACLTTLGHAPNKTMDGFLGDSQIQTRATLNSCTTALDGSQNNFLEVFQWIRQVRASQWYLFLHPLGTACILWSHETGHCGGPGGTQDPLHYPVEPDIRSKDLYQSLI